MTILITYKTLEINFCTKFSMLALCGRKGVVKYDIRGVDLFINNGTRFWKSFETLLSLRYAFIPHLL
jgi:hypothetical protein